MGEREKAILRDYVARARLKRIDDSEEIVQILRLGTHPCDRLLAAVLVRQEEGRRSAGLGYSYRAAQDGHSVTAGDRLDSFESAA
jgi:hypothetical protein